MKFFVAGLSYRTAPVELRERLAISPSSVSCCGCRLRSAGGLSEVVVLSTCNRVEIYGVASSPQRYLGDVFCHLSPRAGEAGDSIYVKEGAEAIKHLFAVTAGLDSMVIGETEITGQVKQTYQSACEKRWTGKVTNRVFQVALQTAKQIRTDTEIGRGATSVGSMAVELAEKVFGAGVDKPSVLVIGAGKMGETCLKHLTKKGAQSVVIANRSFGRAEELARAFGGAAIRFDDRFSALVQADIVVSSTGAPELILQKRDIEAAMAARGNRPLFLIDIAVPRDVDPAVQEIDNVFLYDIDDLESLVHENIRHREQELAKCRTMIEENALAVLSRLQGIPTSRGRVEQTLQPTWGLQEATA